MCLLKNGLLELCIGAGPSRFREYIFLDYRSAGQAIISVQVLKELIHRYTYVVRTL